MKILKYIFALTVLLSFAACSFDSGSSSEVNLPPSTGKSGELVVIVEDDIWNSPIGDNLFNLMTVNSYGLPQPEPIFDLVQIPKQSFSSIFETHRNVLFLKYGEKSGISIKKNIWAKDQLVIELVGSSELELSNFVEEYAPEITRKFEDEDIIRIQSELESVHNTILENKLEEEHGFSLHVPKDYSLDDSGTGNNFYFLRKDTPQMTQCLWIHVQDYSDVNAFNPETIKKLRNKIGKEHIEGPVANSYMGTEDGMPLGMETIEIDGNYAVEARGLWKMEGDFMGGPFLTYTILNKNKNKLITVEGFMFAPKYKKRNYMQQTEAILKTISFQE